MLNREEALGLPLYGSFPKYLARPNLHWVCPLRAAINYLQYLIFYVLL